jgi:hypothetical protein
MGLAAAAADDVKLHGGRSPIMLLEHSDCLSAYSADPANPFVRQARVIESTDIEQQP